VDITWYGHSCFRISERGKMSTITDPFSEQIGLPLPKLKGDVVTVSHNASGHNHFDAVKGRSYVVEGPGEYEIGGVFISGVALHNIDEESIENTKKNVAYVIRYDTLTVVHLGDLMHAPDQSTIEALGEVNVVLVPVGGGGGLKASTAAEVIALIEPNYIVPMHYAIPGLQIDLDPVDKFLKEMGVSNPQEDDLLRVTTSTLPEQPQVVVLRPQTQA
jgi:L-ascorbate metabolism protein UlaG (beta-lactamase superfamily)